VFTGFQTTAAGRAADEVLLIIPAKLPFYDVGAAEKTPFDPRLTLSLQREARSVAEVMSKARRPSHSVI